MHDFECNAWLWHSAACVWEWGDAVALVADDAAVLAIVIVREQQQRRHLAAWFSWNARRQR
jgi:hypothetical protein